MPSNNSDHTGMFHGARRVASRLGSASGTSTAIAPARMANAPNAQRHNPNWANSPPAAGPSSVPTPHIADTNADALVHSHGGNTALITA